jgi:hypothetical protein
MATLAGVMRAAQEAVALEVVVVRVLLGKDLPVA